MPDLIWSPRSSLDLAGIDAFLAQHDPAAAIRTLRAIQSAARRLTDYPRLGRSFDAPLPVIGVRGTPYLILYRLRAGVVEIARVRHTRDNWVGEIEAEL